MNTLNLKCHVDYCLTQKRIVHRDLMTKGGTFMQSFEDIFKYYFDNQNNMPNPFDPDAFSDFIKESIRSSFPDQSGEFGQQGPWGQDGAGPFNQSQSQNQSQGGGGPQFNAHKQRPNKGNSNGIRHNIFETHDHIIARIASDPQSNTEPPTSILLNSHELLLKGHDTQEPILHVQLPKPVSARHTKVDFREGILEISMLKKSQEPFTEIVINDVVHPINRNSTSMQKS